MKDELQSYPGTNLVYHGEENSDFRKYFSFQSGEPDGKGIIIENIPDPQNQMQTDMVLKVKAGIGQYDILTEQEVIHLGNLDSAREDTLYENPVDAWVKHTKNSALKELLFYAPYWIEQIANKKEEVAGIKIHTTGRVLLVYRLTEICLRVIDQWKGDQSYFSNSRALLVRQRYRYLLGLAWLRMHNKQGKKDFDCVTNFYSIIRNARSEYTRLLLEQTDRLEMALNVTQTPGLKPGWDLDEEVKLLIYEYDLGVAPARATDKLLPYAWERLPDQILTDQIMRRWILSRDDLPGVTRLVSSVVLFAKPEGATGWLPQCISWLYQKIHYLIIAGAAFCLLGLFLEKLVVVGIAALVGLAIPLATLLLANRLGNFPWEAQVFYPLALRIPAMSMVGVLAVAGLADAYIVFGFSAFSSRNWFAAAALILGCLIPSWLYIRFEVNSRRIMKQYVARRSWLLFLYCAAASIWLGTFAGWLSDPIGLTKDKDVLYLSSEVTYADLLEPICLTKDEDVLYLSSEVTYDDLLEPICLPKDIGVLHPYITLFNNRISFSFVVIMSALALLVGVFTQIFWEDKAIAEPL